MWVNSNSQLDISFMIYPNNRKCFNFPESLANQKKKVFKMFKVFLFSFSWAPSQFRTVCVCQFSHTQVKKQHWCRFSMTDRSCLSAGMMTNSFELFSVCLFLFVMGNSLFVNLHQKGQLLLLLL